MEEVWARRGIRRIPFNLVDVVEVRGALDIGRLSDALSALIQRHSAFRTSVRPRHGMPQAARDYQLSAFERTGVCDAGLFEQSVVPVRPPRIARRRMPSVAEENWHACVAGIVFEQSSMPFDYARPPLLRLVALRITISHHVLVVAVPCLVCDSASLDILWRDLLRLYADPGVGPAAEVESESESDGRIPGPGQFHAFAAWQSAQQFTGHFRAAVSYWQERWTSPGWDQLPPHALDFWKRGLGTGLPATLGHSVTVEPRLSEAVRRAADELQASVYVLCLTAFAMLLSQASGRECVSIWMTCPNRRHGTARDAIGWISNAHLVALPVARGEVREVIAGCARAIAEAHEREELPLPMLWRLLGRSYIRPGSRIMFEWIPAVPAESAGDLSMRRLVIDTRSRASGIGLCLRVLESVDSLVVNVLYSNMQFRSADVGESLQRYCGILHRIVRDVRSGAPGSCRPQAGAQAGLGASCEGWR